MTGTGTQTWTTGVTTIALLVLRTGELKITSVCCLLDLPINMVTRNIWCNSGIFFSYFSIKTYAVGPCQGTSNEYSQHMSFWRARENYPH